MSSGCRAAIRWIAHLMEVAAYVCLMWIGYALDFDLPHEGEPAILLQWFIEWSKSCAHLVVYVSAGVVLVVRVLKWGLAESPPASRVIDRLVSTELDKLRSQCFEEISPSEPRDNNRVTLFKHVRWKWLVSPAKSALWPWGWGRGPSSGWLVVMHRSGHATQGSGSIFLAPDDAPNAEGVAGRAWRADGAVRVRKLPDLKEVRYIGYFRSIWLRLRERTRFTSGSVEAYAQAREKIRTYAKAGGVSAESVWKRIKHGKKNPTTILAVPVETTDNMRWGVLVLDSCNDVQPIDTDTREFRRAFNALEKRLASYGITTTREG